MPINVKGEQTGIHVFGLKNWEATNIMPCKKPFFSIDVKDNIYDEKNHY
jgi:hypothetical protein